jgi:hypothetical protein
MTHTRYWAATLATAVCAAFIVVASFAFRPYTAAWVVFGVAIGATVTSLAGLLVALARDSQSFSGLSAVNVLAGGWTIIAMVTLAKPAAAWVAFADGIAITLVSLLGLSLHETWIERVIHAVQPADGAVASLNGPTRRMRVTGQVSLQISASMRSWLAWLANAAIAVCGAFIVIVTFAMSRPGAHHASPRWIAFGVAIAAASIAVGSLVERALDRSARTADWDAEGRLALIATAVANLLVAAALIVTMLVYAGSTARWLAFAFGCGLAGFALVALAVHEITTERVRHELEVAAPTAVGASASGPAGAVTA